jgi:hypothetical protein
MDNRLKKMLLYSSLGSVLVGAGVALSKKKAKPESSALQMQRIPADCPKILVLTEAVPTDNPKVLRRERYVLLKTPFKVWSVLDLPVNPDADNPAGAGVYHVTWYEIREKPGQVPPVEMEKGRFYGTVAAGAGGAAKKNYIARGSVLQIYKSYVGGASNGVETGEVHLSSAPILNYRFEYAPEERKSGGPERL